MILVQFTIPENFNSVTIDAEKVSYFLPYDSKDTSKGTEIYFIGHTRALYVVEGYATVRGKIKRAIQSKIDKEMNDDR